MCVHIRAFKALKSLPFKFNIESTSPASHLPHLIVSQHVDPVAVAHQPKPGLCSHQPSAWHWAVADWKK